MATAVELPQLGNTVEECLVTRWFKRKGDTVTAGEVVVEIETDKTTFEITAPVDGMVLERFVDEGAIVPVFTKLLVIGEEGELLEGEATASSPSASSALARAPSSATSPALAPAGVGADVGPRVDGGSRAAAVSPRARALAADYGVDPAVLVGTGPNGRVIERDVRAAQEQAQPRVGTPLSPTRQTIARRMRASLSSSAQYTLHTSANATALLAARAQQKQARGAAAPTINDLVMLCTVRALRAAPEMNAELIDGRLVLHAEVHLAFACDTPRGLVAPVVRNAHSLALDELTARTRDLTAKAVDGTIAAADVSGATFTVSNLGGLGIDAFTPVLNPPQVGILGVGAVTLKPLRVDGRVEFVDIIGLSLTCDHQAIDGAPGARFLQVLRAQLETVSLDG
jgi:pyruvate dehydrogenase E2 component (dihydrolipoamide acetyltransferase)